MQRRVLVINGPNLNLLGDREPQLYGTTTLSEIEAACIAAGREHGIEVGCRQSNHEGEIVELIHAARDGAEAIVINPGGYGHTSIAIHDALAAFDGPIVEVHLSNIHRREPFRHQTYTSRVATGMICGLGADGYLLALDALARRLPGA